MKKIEFDKMNPNEHKSVINAMHEEERDIISNNLHSQIGSHLSIARLFIDSIIEKTEGEIQEMALKSKELIDISIAEFKVSMQAISPRLIRQFGFSGALYQTIRFYKEISKIKIEFESKGEYLSKNYTEDASLLRLIQQSIEILIELKSINQITVNLDISKEKKTFNFLCTEKAKSSFYDLIKKEDWFKFQLRAWVLNAKISNYDNITGSLLKIEI